MEALPELVRVLTEEDPGSEKVKEAADNVRGIASGSDANREAVVAAGALAGLVRVLMEAGPGAENIKWAAQALRNIAFGPNAPKEAVVAAGALAGLVRVLNEAEPGTENVKWAAQALRNIAAGPGALKEAAVAAGVLAGLVRVMKEVETGTENIKWATQALNNIAAGPDALKEAAVAAGALAGLVRVLNEAEPGTENVQCATRVINNIAAGSDELAQAVVAAGALAGLVRVLTEEDPGSESAQCATCAICNITAGPDALKEAAVAAGVLAGLVRVLKEVGPGTENAQWAAQALRNIAFGPNAPKEAVVAAGALTGLVRVLNEAGPETENAHWAARALRNIAAGPDALKEAAVAAGALAGLVRVLREAEPGSENVQWTTHALVNIASGPDALKEAVVAAGAMPSLVRVLRNVAPDSTNAENAVWALANVSEGNYVGKQAVLEAGAIPWLLKVMENSQNYAEGGKRAIYALLRMAQHPPARAELAEHNAVERLVVFNEMHIGVTDGAALLAAATAGGSEEAERMAGRPETLQLITSSLHQRVQDDPEGNVLQLSDFVEGVAMLTVNGQNKYAMVDMETGNSIVALLFRILEASHPSDVDVKAHAVRALWNLALSDDIRVMMQEKQSLMARMKEAKEAFKGCGHGALIKAIDGVLFECGERDEDAKARVAEANVEATSSSSGSSEPWVMISYNWGHQNVALHLRDQLQERGFNVWIDVEQMSGDTIEAMAEAVEGAAVVVSVMTIAYKQSPNCQSELKYTNKLCKPIVPVVAEPGYTPDGWLGLILGDELYHDFSQAEQWRHSTEGVAAEVARHMNGMGGSTAPATDIPIDIMVTPTSAPASAPSTPRDCVACATDILPGAKFCDKCGALTACPECGTEYLRGHGQKFCSNCRAKVLGADKGGGCCTIA